MQPFFRRFNILEDYPLEKQLEEIDINFKGPVQVTNIFLKNPSGERGTGHCQSDFRLRLCTHDRSPNLFGLQSRY